MFIKTLIKCGTIFLFLFFVLGESKAQKRSKKENLQKQSLWASHIEMDGDLKEWEGDKFFSLHSDEFLYLIKNDEEYLYLAFQVFNKERQFQILSQGIQLSFNGSKARKPIQSIRYPLADRHDDKEGVSENKNVDIRAVALQSVRGIGVRGFDHLTDGLISLSNTFGIVAKSLLVDDNSLHIEIKVPISLLESKKHGIDIEGAIAINIKAHDFVNLPSRNRRNSDSEGGRNSNNRRGSSQYVVQYANNTGMWLEVLLAKPH